MDKQTQELIIAALDRLEGSVATIRGLVSGKTTVKPPVKPPEPKPSDISRAEQKKLEHQTKVAEKTAERLEKAAERAAERKQAKFQTAQSLPADQLGPTPNFNSPQWPQAVLQHLIVTDDDDDVKKCFRAVQMLGLMGVSTAGIRVLDCGCGEGYTAAEAAATASEVVGYDIVRYDSWNKFTERTLKFTTDKADDAFKKPFDFIILYDVIDHLEGENPDEFLQWIKSILAPGGKVFMRCHPWTSKHGGHLYEKINKAYIHLALTVDELVKAGFKPTSNLKINRPLATYDNLISQAGFVVETRKGHNEPAGNFFSGELLDRIIKITWRGTIDHDTALKIMSNQFIDYVLSVK